MSIQESWVMDSQEKLNSTKLPRGYLQENCQKITSRSLKMIAAKKVTEWLLQRKLSKS